MAKYLMDLEQRSPAWHNIRAGVLSASKFKDVVTPTGKISSKRNGLIGKMLVESFLGELPEPPVSEAQKFWMQRGNDLEAEAREAYERLEFCEVEECGFIFRGDGEGIDRHIGVSPDGLVDNNGLVEIKCPAPGTHFTWLYKGLKEEEMPSDHFAQVQGQIWVSGREWCDFFSYYPGLPPLLLRIEPDAKFQAALEEHIPAFIGEFLEIKDYLTEFFKTQEGMGGKKKDG